MSYIGNRKGLAELVTSVLLILIVISAISIFFAGYLKNSALSLSPEISCTEIRINNPIEIINSCYDPASHEVKVSIKRNLDNLPIEDIGFSLSQDNLKEEWLCGETCGTCTIISSGNEETYILRDIQRIEFPENLVLSIGSCTLQNSQITLCK